MAVWTTALRASAISSERLACCATVLGLPLVVTELAAPGHGRRAHRRRLRTATRAGSIDRCTSPPTAYKTVATRWPDHGAPPRVLPKRRRAAPPRDGARSSRSGPSPRSFEELGLASLGGAEGGIVVRAADNDTVPCFGYVVKQNTIGTHGRRESHRAGTPPGPGV